MPGVSSYEAIMSTVRFLERFKGGEPLKGVALTIKKQAVLEAADAALTAKKLQGAKINLAGMDSFERAVNNAGVYYKFSGKLVNDIKGFNSLSAPEQALAVDKLRRLSSEGDNAAELFLQEIINAPKWRAMARNHR